MSYLDENELLSREPFQGSTMFPSERELSKDFAEVQGLYIFLDLVAWLDRYLQKKHTIAPLFWVSAMVLSNSVESIMRTLSKSTFDKQTCSPMPMTLRYRGATEEIYHARRTPEEDSDHASKNRDGLHRGGAPFQVSPIESTRLSDVGKPSATVIVDTTRGNRVSYVYIPSVIGAFRYGAIKLLKLRVTTTIRTMLIGTPNMRYIIYIRL